jgi:hypothetical protein
VADRVVVVDQLDTAGRHQAHVLRQRPGTLLGTGLKKRGTQNVAVPEFSFSARRHQSSERSWWLSDGNPQGSDIRSAQVFQSRAWLHLRYLSSEKG